MDREQLEKAASAAGIAADYINAKGEREAISPETIALLLEAMEDPVDRSARPIAPVSVIVGEAEKVLAVEGEGDFSWQLVTEAGESHSGHVQGGQRIALPDLAQGYHELTLTQHDNSWQCRIIIAPARCFEPEALTSGGKLWGACAQLYTLRSEHNWGIGDFGDLARMLKEVARRGGAFIGLNPIHSLYPASPESASPYSPSSRRWLNVIYIDVAAVPDFQQSEAAQRWWQEEQTQNLLAKARDSKWVDYRTVTELKLTALRFAWQQFKQRDEQDAGFQSFVAEGGDSLYWQAAYDAMHQEMLRQDGSRWGWPAWPDEYRRASRPAVAEFCQQHDDDVQFYLWLQWLADSQFDQCWQQSQQDGMPVGLYRDLAVGVAQGGAETWHDAELYRLKASVGAPPDILGPQGQNWGLPPMDPHVMRERGYQPFIELLRANMSSCGALRIDHVMSMLRLWWIPYGMTADHGAYIYYPVDDLLAILALESQRSQCMVLGEDLGTVPEEIVDKLRDSGVYSWKVLYFEQENATTYRLPAKWPRQAMASATTHDLPTLAGYWGAEDLSLGEKLGVYPDKEVLAGLYEQRAEQKQALLNALHEHGCLPDDFPVDAESCEMSPTLNQAMHNFLADTHSALLGLQPEDWLEMSEPVNVPGTVDEYPNWRRKLSATLEEMFARPELDRLLESIQQRRAQ